MASVAREGIERRFEKLASPQLKKLGPGYHSDGRGLYLLVQESGSRSWILRVTVRGKRREIGLGGLADVSLAEARDKAAELRKRARNGEDVVEARRIEKRVIPTFKAAAIEYHKIIRGTFTSEAHAYNWLQSLETHVFPAIGSRTVDVIDTADVLRALEPIWTTRPETARRTLRRVRRVFEYCRGKNHRNVMVGNMAVPLPNPCDGIKGALGGNTGREKHHKALPYPDLPEFIQKLRKTKSAVIVKLALEFTILTAVRTSEALLAEWDEFDLEENVWLIPAARMKMKEPHKVPLSPRCVEILKLAKDFNDEKVVFPGRKEGQPLSNMSMLMALRRMEYEDLTVHGFRSTFKTWAQEKTKFDHLVIEAALAHQVKGIERHYLRTTFFDQRRKLMDQWARFATAAPTAKVARIGR